MTHALAPATAGVPVPRGKSRLVFVDNLRVLVTILVVAHHAAQAYGPTGGEWPVGEDPRSRLLGVMITVNSMFFMGLFFFVSGYFTPGTLRRKGGRAFLTDRLWRFGVPCALVLGLTAWLRGRAEYLHLWFVADLFAFNVLYSLIVRGRKNASAPPAEPRRIGWVHLLAVVLILAAVTALVRVTYPVDAWLRVGWILPLEPAHLPQYLGLYALGVWAAGAEWLQRFPDRLGRDALAIGASLVAGFAIHRLWPERTTVWFLGGGATWQNPAYALLESAICVTLGVGLLWLFRRHVAEERPWLRAFAADAYGIYCVHLPIVVGIHVALAGFAPSPLVKFAAATVFATLVSWGITRWALRSTEFGRRIF